MITLNRNSLALPYMHETKEHIGNEVKAARIASGAPTDGA